MTAAGGPPAAARPKWRRWIKPALAALAAFVLLLAPWWGPVVLRPLNFFHVRHVEVVGTRYLEPREILARLQVDTMASVWDDTEAMRERVAKHPLVRDVQVTRDLPGTIVVRVSEHVPVALVPTQNGFLVYDERRVILPIDPTLSDVDVPVVARPDSGVLRLLGAMRADAPALYERLSDIRWEPTSAGGGELVIMLDSIPVRAGAGVTLQRLTDLELVERDLARRRLRVVELDLRYRDQVIARLQ